MADQLLGNLVWKITGDSTNFDKTLGRSETGLAKFGKTAAKIGGNLTKAVTLPLLGLGVVATKLASDAEESLNAVSVVFENATDSVVEFGKSASTSVGLSSTEFNGLATVIGAQLKQSGQDIDTVAESTITLTKRAADLASVYNTDVKDAAGALGAALRGESEPARRFGILLSDAAVQAEALSLGLVGNKSEITDQIKVQSRYSLILKQSADVADDFTNTSDGLANSTRILLADIKDLGADLGEVLLPIAKDIINTIKDVVGRFSELDDSTKKLIITVAGVAAAAGPAIGAIGKLSTAITFLAANPAILIIGGLAITIGAIAVSVAKAAKEQREFNELLENTVEQADALDPKVVSLTAELANLQAKTELSSDEQARQSELLAIIDKQYPELSGSIRENALEVAKNTLQLQENNRELAAKSLAAAIEEERVLTKTWERQTEALKDNIFSRWQATQGVAEGKEATDAAIKAEEEFLELLESADITKLKELAADVGSSYQDLGTAAFTTAKNLDRVTEATQYAQGELNYYDLNVKQAKENIEALTEAIEAKKKALEEDGDAEETDVERQIRVRKAQESILSDIEKRLAQERRLGLITAEEETRALIDANEDLVRALLEVGYTGETNEYGDRAIRRSLKAIEEYQEALIETESAVYTIRDRMLADEEARLNKSIENYKKRNEEIKEAEEERIRAVAETEAQAIRTSLTVAQNVYGNLSTIIGSYYDYKTALAEGDEEEQKRIAKEQFEVNKALQIANIAINTAAAIVGFLANPGGPAGVGLSFAAGLTGVIQAGLIASTPAPAFATGVENFTVPPGYPNDSFPIMVQSGETVDVKTPAQQSASNNQPVKQEFYFNQEMFFSVMNYGLRSGKVQVPQKALV